MMYPPQAARSLCGRRIANKQEKWAAVAIVLGLALDFSNGLRTWDAGSLRVGKNCVIQTEVKHVFASTRSEWISLKNVLKGQALREAMFVFGVG
jgi:hypothetical protein